MPITSPEELAIWVATTKTVSEYRSVWMLVRILHAIPDENQEARAVIKDLLLIECEGKSIISILHAAWLAGRCYKR